MKGYKNSKSMGKGSPVKNQPSGNHADNGGWKPRVKGVDKPTGKSASKVKY